jgi:hypothetical protein
VFLAVVLYCANLPGHFFPGRAFTTERLVFAAIASCAIFILMSLLYPIILWRNKKRHPHQRLSWATIQADELTLLKSSGRWMKDHGPILLACLVVVMIGLSVADTIFH